MASISRLFRFLPTKPKPYSVTLLSSSSSSTLTRRPFSSQSNTNSPISFPDSDDDDHHVLDNPNNHQVENANLPPPYDPFDKKPVIEHPKDPSDLQQIFHDMRTKGLVNDAIKMFDALSKDGLTHQAMHLFSLIRENRAMPDVVAHTAVVEAYSNAGGHTKEALKAFVRMQASGVEPNAYTYTVLIKGLARDGRLKEAGKYLVEMMEKEIRPNVGTYVAVFEAFVREGAVEEGRRVLEEMKAKGFAPDKNGVRDHIDKRGQVFRGVMNLLFNE